MKTFKTKLSAVVIFGSLATLVLLLGFQNCSSSLAALGFGTPTRASDISDMLQKSRNELDSTVGHFKSNSRGINSVSAEEKSSVDDEVINPRETKSKISVKLVKKHKHVKN